ncbi:MAG: hypothetical protein AAFN07_10280, partial [Pseudomonadota bacterium]
FINEISKFPVTSVACPHQRGIFDSPNNFETTPKSPENGADSGKCDVLRGGADDPHRAQQNLQSSLIMDIFYP